MYVKILESCQGKGRIVTSDAVGFPVVVYFLDLLPHDFHEERFIHEVEFGLEGGDRAKEPWYVVSVWCCVHHIRGAGHTVTGLDSYGNGSVL